ncbi:hypothetical protein GTP44_03875 [Duganella sp. FT50W]|uniref:Uncharacterized protein n=1 Tax=Duganella lactea TaxID=2692173 RepID=A0A6L8MNY6_9BURK|nr:hypothetical protein [Duganella lactea]MYM81098.1 hypothetical protein [Duganella lactea]
MNYRVITQEEQEHARYWHNSAEAIKRKAAALVDNLAVLFAADGDLGSIGLVFQPDPEKRHLALVESPTNSG